MSPVRVNDLLIIKYSELFVKNPIESIIILLIIVRVLKMFSPTIGGLDDELDENMCIFCGEKNPKFAQEGGLDVHYWKSCPLLQRCHACSQVRSLFIKITKN